MADYSKQFCKATSIGFEGDYDILEECSNLQPEHYIPQICEGYGFIAIGKDKNGNCILAIPSEKDPEEVIWKKYEEVVTK